MCVCESMLWLQNTDMQKAKILAPTQFLPMKNQHQKRVKMSVKMSKISTGSKKVAQTITTITAISGATSTWCQCWSILPGGPAHHSSPALSEYYVILKKNAQRSENIQVKLGSKKSILKDQKIKLVSSCRWRSLEDILNVTCNFNGAGPQTHYRVLPCKSLSTRTTHPPTNWPTNQGWC